MIKGTIKGILTNCTTNVETIVDIDYEITDQDGRRIFKLLNGVTGHEGFYIDHVGINPFIDSFMSDIDKMRKYGWLACTGTKDMWNKLFIPADQMQKALNGVTL